MRFIKCFLLPILILFSGIVGISWLAYLISGTIEGVFWILLWIPWLLPMFVGSLFDDESEGKASLPIVIVYALLSLIIIVAFIHSASIVDGQFNFWGCFWSIIGILFYPIISLFGLPELSWLLLILVPLALCIACFSIMASKKPSYKAVPQKKIKSPKKSHYSNNTTITNHSVGYSQKNTQSDYEKMCLLVKCIKERKAGNLEEARNYTGIKL